MLGLGGELDRSLHPAIAVLSPGSRLWSAGHNFGVGKARAGWRQAKRVTRWHRCGNWGVGLA